MAYKIKLFRLLQRVVRFFPEFGDYIYYYYYYFDIVLCIFKQLRSRVGNAVDDFIIFAAVVFSHATRTCAHKSVYRGQ